MAEREEDSIRQERQRPDHRDRQHGPTQEAPEPPPQIQDYDLEPQPADQGRQPERPGQPGRWEPRPGGRDQPGGAREPERRPQGQHEKA